jgi:GDP-4-dehydro-6-deoxy-D-mannose reductase
VRILVTGASGFVGRWLVRELTTADHVPVGMDQRPDVRDREALARWIDAARPDAIVHLAAVAFGPDAAADPATALAINVGGTANLIECVRRHASAPALLVVGSSDVYAAPADSRPIDEDAALGPRGPYGLTKLGQEAVALAAAQRHGLRLIVVRPFNHTGPGQRPSFVVPALARRIAAVRSGAARSVPAGNLDVRRDIGDVRDVVRAYRLLVERLVEGVGPGDQVFNVATGETVSVREIIDRLAAIAGIEPVVEVDPSLVRPNDPPLIQGDAGRLRRLIGWRPEIPLARTLDEVMTEALGSETG